MDAAEIDKELEALETKAEHLRALYEQYFMGMERIEPLVMRRDVERRILVLRREQLRNTAQRFKFNTLVQRFNTMQQHWARIVREIENGTYRRDVIRAAARFGVGAIAILGGWKNTKHVFARINEHGEGRLEIDIDPHSDDERMRAVARGQPYHFKVERADGKKVEWSVNGVVYFDFTDPEPLAGPGHEHFGFNDWDAPVCFDNLKVTPL